MEKSDKLNEDINIVIDESIKPYYTDIFSPWETKEQLEIGKEVKGNIATYNACLIQSWTETISPWVDTILTTLTNVSGESSMTSMANRITIKQSGTYLISLSFFDATWNAIGVRNAVIKKNGTNVFVTRRNAMATDVGATFPVICISGDYIEMSVYQNSGSNMIVSTAFISAIKIT